MTLEGPVKRNPQLAVVRPKTNRMDSSGRLIGNKILLSIPGFEYQILRPKLEPVELPQRLALHEPHEKQNYAYFLNCGLASIIVAMNGGRGVEAGVVGCEGVVGTGLAVGLDHSPLRVIMQVEGDGVRVEADDFRAVLRDAPELNASISRYAVLQGMQIAQTAACNRLHDVRQRLARWLLMAQDRVDDKVIPLTQNFLATMLGTDRPSVTLAAGSLRKRRAIRYRRAAVEIVSRSRLEASACECYRVTRDLGRKLGLNLD